MDLTNNIEWKDGVSGGTPLMAENLNRVNKGTKTALEELESETQANIAAVQDSVTALKNGLENGSVVVNKSNNDGEGNNIVGTYAKQNGSYSGLAAGAALKDAKGNVISSYYQSKLNFDAVPLDGSLNPVTSGGVKSYVDTNREICKAGNMTVSEGSTIDNQFIIKTNVYLGGVPHQKIQYFGVVTTRAPLVFVTCPDGFGDVFKNISLTLATEVFNNAVGASFSKIKENEIEIWVAYDSKPSVDSSFNFIITTIK